MRLNDLLPETYEYNEEEIEMDLSFDNILDIFDVLKMIELSEYHRAELCLTLLFGEDIIEDIKEDSDLHKEFLTYFN